MRKVRIVALLLLAITVARPGLAQPGAEATTLASALSPLYHPTLQLAFTGTSETAEARPLPLPKYGSWVGITKWATLAATVGLGTAGALLHHDANEKFARLEDLCSSDPDNCRSRNPDGSYTDPQLERLFDNVSKKDQQARAAFIGAQVTFATSVLLFIVDFQKAGRPGNIPYDPDKEKSALRFTALPGELALRYYFR